MVEKIADEFERFKKFLKQLIAVPKEEIEEKLEEYREKRASEKEEVEPD
jgi:anaerobic ribonucleoside-triphosphate reductase